MNNYPSAALCYSAEMRGDPENLVAHAKAFIESFNERVKDIEVVEDELGAYAKMNMEQAYADRAEALARENAMLKNKIKRLESLLAK